MTSINATNKLEFSLREAGLDSREIQLYLASLKIGDSGMSELARVAGIKRTSAYVVFDALEAKGLLGTYTTKSGKRFVAKSPKFLFDKAKRQFEAMQEILPELEAISAKNDKKPKITYYEGAEQYRNVVEECLLRPNTIIRHIGSLAYGHEVLSDSYDTKHFAPERIKKNIFLKGLYFPDVKKFFKDDDDKKKREIRYLPKEFDFKTLTLICENKVIITTTKEQLIVVVIESNEIAEAETKKFDLLWDLIKKYPLFKAGT